VAINVIVSQLGKAARPIALDNSVTINELCRQLSIDPNGKSFTVSDVSNGVNPKTGNYMVQDGDQVRITANNAAA
jgi:hypothetical protein